MHGAFIFSRTSYLYKLRLASIFPVRVSERAPVNPAVLYGGRGLPVVATAEGNGGARARRVGFLT